MGLGSEWFRECCIAGVGWLLSPVRCMILLETDLSDCESDIHAEMCDKGLTKILHIASLVMYVSCRC